VGSPDGAEPNPGVVAPIIRKFNLGPLVIERWFLGRRFAHLVEAANQELVPIRLPIAPDVARVMQNRRKCRRLTPGNPRQLEGQAELAAVSIDVFLHRAAEVGVRIEAALELRIVLEEWNDTELILRVLRDHRAGPQADQPASDDQISDRAHHGRSPHHCSPDPRLSKSAMRPNAQ